MSDLSLLTKANTAYAADDAAVAAATAPGAEPADRTGPEHPPKLRVGHRLEVCRREIGGPHRLARRHLVGRPLRLRAARTPSRSKARIRYFISAISLRWASMISSASCARADPRCLPAHW